MSITPSNEVLWNWPREGNYDFASLFKRQNEASKIQEIHTWEASKVHEIKDDNVHYSFYKQSRKLIITFEAR